MRVLRSNPKSHKIETRNNEKLMVQYANTNRLKDSAMIIIIITVYISAEGEIILQFANNAHIMFIGPA